MVSGPETHAWRITQLEGEVKAIKRKIDVAVYLLFVNLLGIISILTQAWWAR